MMTHSRWWALSLLSAVCGAFLVVVRFAFSVPATPWIAFGVAIGVTVLSVAALMLALLRKDQAFLGLSALSALVAAWTIIAMLTLTRPTAGWLAFANGLALLAISIRALALHETSVERIVHALEQEASQAPEPGRSPVEADVRAASRRRSGPALAAPAAMRSWLEWVALTSIAVIGAFLVILTFALTRVGTHHASPRWIAFALGIGTLFVALGCLLARAPRVLDGTVRDEWSIRGRRGQLIAASCNGATAVALIVTMCVYSGTGARWVAFALGCALAGISLLALVHHEVTSERVRHELEVTEQPLGAGRSAIATEVGSHGA